MNLLIEGGRLIDPRSNHNAIVDIAVSEGKILAFGPVPEGFKPDTTINAHGCVV